MPAPIPFPSEIDVDMVGGDSKVLKIEVVDRDGAPFSMAAMDVGRYAIVNSRGRVMVEKTLGAGVTLVNEGANWFFQVALDEDDTQDLAPGFYDHQGEIRNTGVGFVATPFIGKLRIIRDVLP